MARMGKESGLNRWVAQALQDSARLAFRRKPDAGTSANAPVGIVADSSRLGFMARMGKLPGFNRIIGPLQQQAARLVFWRKPVADNPDQAPASPLQPDVATPIPAAAIDASSITEQTRPEQPGPKPTVDEPEEEVFLSLDEPLTAAPGIDELISDDVIPSAVSTEAGSPDQLFTDQTDPDQVFTDASDPDQIFTDTSDPDQVFTDASDPDQIFADQIASEPVAPVAAELVTDQPVADQSAAEQSTPDIPEQPAAAVEAIAEDVADVAPASRMQRVLAVLSRKKVWVPSVSFALLAVVGSLVLMLVHSKQEQHRLQTELLAAQKAGKPAPANAHAAAHPPAPIQVAKIEAAPDHVAPDTHEPEPIPSAGAPTDSAQAGEPGVADAQPGIDPGDCIITDQASVLKNLRRCIDSFNTATAR